METSHDITQLLIASREGDAQALDQLLPHVYAELRAIARRQLGPRASGHTLSPTAVVHEAYLKLVNHAQTTWKDRGHFYAVAATAMRQILIDYARRQLALKRGGGVHETAIDDNELRVEARAAEIIELDQAMRRLRAVSERLNQVVELRFFGGLSVEETAEALGVDSRTVERDWRKARMFLYRELNDRDVA
jgi:RNA polymerase sigma-70 factor (ECF subfamily)